MRNIVGAVVKELKENRSIALAFITKKHGATPQIVGAALAADAEGRLLAGTIGGGLLEKNVLEACSKSIREGKKTVVDFSLSNEDASKNGMICGGNVSVLVMPVRPTPENMDFFADIENLVFSGNHDECSTEHKEYVLAINLDVNSSEMLLPAYRGKNPDSVTIEKGQDRSGFCGQLKNLLLNQGEILNPEINISPAGKWLIEPLNIGWRMLICGAGHIGSCTAQIGHLCNFSITLIDDRKEFLSVYTHPYATLVYAPDYKNFFNALCPDARTCIIIVTEGHLHDASVLKAALDTNAGYIGMIGSLRKREMVYRELEKGGIPEKRLKLIHCPIGLDIHAVSPMEIAISIVGECILYRHTQPMRKPSPESSIAGEKLSPA